MKDIKIISYDDDAISFSDGSSITFDHDQDCCENNYADFSVLDVFYHGETFKDYHILPNEDGFILVLDKATLETDNDYSFYNEMKIFIPCYSDQNGYYTNNLDIYINGKDKVRCLSIGAKLLLG